MIVNTVEPNNRVRVKSHPHRNSRNCKAKMGKKRTRSFFEDERSSVQLVQPAIGKSELRKRVRFCDTTRILKYDPGASSRGAVARLTPNHKELSQLYRNKLRGLKRPLLRNTVNESNKKMRINDSVESTIPPSKDTQNNKKRGHFNKNVANTSESQKRESIVNELHSSESHTEVTIDASDTEKVRSNSPIEETPKKSKKGNSPELVVVLIPTKNNRTKKKKKKTRSVKVLRGLLDSGANGCIIKEKFVAKQTKKIIKKEKVWETAAGTITTNKMCELKFNFPEFSDSKEITAPFNIIKENSNYELEYDIIIGRNVLSDLGIILNFNDNTIKWEDQEVEMKDPSFFKNKNQLFSTFYSSSEPDEVKEMAFRAEQIADAHYEKADLAKIVKENCSHLNIEERNELYKLLLSFEDLFDGTLGEWKTEPVDLELKKDANPCHSTQFSVPFIHHDTLKKEIA